MGRALLAGAVGGRFGAARPFAAGAAVSLVALLLLNSSGSFTTYAIGACMQTFAIGFMLPFAITEVAELDVDGRYVVLSVPAIGIGAMAGPGIAGVLSQSGDFSSLLGFVAVTIITSALLITISAARARAGTVQLRV